MNFQGSDDSGNPKCWCCGDPLKMVKALDECIFPYICGPCLTGKHSVHERDSDRFEAFVRCECKMNRSVRVNRPAAWKLFEKREQIKCKGCKQRTPRLHLWQTTTDIIVVPERGKYKPTKAKVEIVRAKEWRDRDPESISTL